jgi:hypothetical protein
MSTPGSTNPKSVVPINPHAEGPDTEPQAAARSRSSSSSAQAASRKAAAAPHSAFVPLLIGLVALLVWLGFQTWLLADERAALQAAHQSQQQTVDNAGKLRASLDALAADTQRLADTGNANAALLVAELKKRGITINPNPSPPAPAVAKP